MWRCCRHGGYPYVLKQRILSKLGHLSNAACAQELPALAAGGTTRFVLAHLSVENNTPEAAYQTALAALSGAGLRQNLDFQLMVAPRDNAEAKMLIFDERMWRGMHSVRVLCVGKLKERYWREAVWRYAKRLQVFCRFTICELPEHRLPERPSGAEVARALEEEGKQLLKGRRGQRAGCFMY